jgi:hypothetical protein
VDRLQQSPEYSCCNRYGGHSGLWGICFGNPLNLEEDDEVDSQVNGPEEDEKSIVDEAEYIPLPTRPSEDIEEGTRPVIV